MSDALLVLNAGSSSLKFSVFLNEDAPRPLVRAIGENTASIRAGVCQDATWLGLELDEEANASGGPCITRERSGVLAWVIPTNEELMIASHTQRVLGSGSTAFVRE